MSVISKLKFDQSGIDGIKVYLSDFGYLEQYREEELINRFKDLMKQSGVVALSQTQNVMLPSSGASDYTVYISAGTAYTANGGRIHLSSTYSFPVTTGDAGKWVIAKFVTMDVDARLHRETGETFYMREVPTTGLSSVFMLTSDAPTAASGDIVWLGKISYFSGGKPYFDYSEDNRQLFSVRVGSGGDALPTITDLYSLGSSSLRWLRLYLYDQITAVTNLTLTSQSGDITLATPGSVKGKDTETGNGAALGSPNLPWASAYIDSLIRSAVALTIETLVGNLILKPAGNVVEPYSDQQIDLGSSTKRWNQLFLKDLIQAASALTLETLAGDLILRPATNILRPYDSNDTLDLGTNTYQFNRLWVKQLNTDDILEIIFSLGGTAFSRSILIEVQRRDSSYPSSTNKRWVVGWWISSSEFYAPQSPEGSHSITVQDGYSLNSDNPTSGDIGGYNIAMLDENRRLSLLISNSHNAGLTTYYIHVDIQGKVYVESFTLYTTG